MRLKSFVYSELEGSPREWSVGSFHLQEINLFVGRNASGKSRLLNCMFALGGLINRAPEKLYQSGSWECVFEDQGIEYKLILRMHEHLVVEEKLEVDGRLLLIRDESGGGKMWAERLGQDFEFKVPQGKLVITSRRDEVQHSYLEPLFAWADSARKYSFGSDFGKTIVYAGPAVAGNVESASDEPAISINPEKVVHLYCDGFNRFGDAFDKDVLKDFAHIGYPCESVHAAPLGIQLDPNQLLALGGRLPLALFVQEKDLPGPTWQHDMSMGMYRALALLIHLNFNIRLKQKGPIIVDDIGEGLDFERSISLIKLIIRKSKKHHIQLLLSTNDRFVMNEVDLEYWHIVHRIKNHVKILDYENSKKVFDQFKFLGLSNFDFFSSESYLDFQQ
jgi:energy-coupling factor transporter ATP-binding protein EcfA2